MNEILTKEIAYEAIQKFFEEKPFVLFGTGTSCAVDFRFGMTALKEYLLNEIPKVKLNPEQMKQWGVVEKALNHNPDLETAMNSIQDEALLNHIVEKTSCILVRLDQEYGYKILTSKISWPAKSLFEILVKSLPETDRILSVATPNYDLLAEYAFENAEIPYITGFTGGICRSLDWSQAIKSVTYREKNPVGKKIRKEVKFKKHIRLYKVHGSLNTFKLNDTTIVENNAWIASVPDGVTRLMVTPGISKYKKLHQSRSTLLSQFDSAIENHSSFLFIGFGFNDLQLNNDSLKKKLKDQNCPGLIITREINTGITQLLNECDNLWVVCKHGDSKNESTRIYNKQYSDWLYLEDKQIWKIDYFTKEILGS